MTDVILYGDIAKKYGKHHKYFVNSVKECLRALEANFKGFMQNIKQDGRYKIIADNKILSEDDLNKRILNTIKIIPIVHGSEDGVGQTILGVVLIVVGAFTSFAGGEYLIAIGANLVLGGVSQMLTKVPKITSGADSVDKNQSYLFDGPVNTTAQGNPVPLAYGKILIGSQVISAGLEAK